MRFDRRLTVWQTARFLFPVMTPKGSIHGDQQSARH